MKQKVYLYNQFTNSSQKLLAYYVAVIIWTCACVTANAENNVLQKPNLKVLDIGNSYTNDATALLPKIVAASGSDISDLCLYKATRGSGSFKSWYDLYNDNDNTTYTIAKVMGGINANITTGNGEAGDGTHCEVGLCRYTAACCYYESLIAPRSGISALGNTFRYDASKTETTYPNVSVTDENALIAQTAAILATENWYECINPETRITGIHPINNSSMGGNITIYDLNGIRASSATRGIKIIRGADGTTKKILH
ncbi:MAG: hypothetical protein IJP70_10690 [Bacteroidales bacterium]|nr:hypothetical protein [Bacteroidales bacterium]